jgi:hypothetical protein
MAQNSRMLVSKPFAMVLVLNTSFHHHMFLLRMVLLSGKIEPLLRWLGRCSMSIGLLENFGPRPSTQLAMF